MTQPSDSATHTVLVVDDEWLIRRLIADFLRSRGLAVIEGENGKDALRVARAPGINLTFAIVDLMMPKMGGLQLLTELREINPDLPALIISGFYNNEVALAQALDDQTVFLQKPFNLKELGAAIDKLLSASVPARATAR